MHGDTVEVDLLPKYLWVKNKEGIIDKVIERANMEVVGTFQRNKRFGFVVPDDKRNTDDVFVKKADFRNAQNGDKVVAKITKYPEKNVSAAVSYTHLAMRPKSVRRPVKICQKKWRPWSSSEEKIVQTRGCLLYTSRKLCRYR